MATSGTETLDTASLRALLGPQLTEEQARLIYEQGADAVVFALLSLAKQLAEKPAVASSHTDPSAPSGQTPLTSSRPPKVGPNPRAPGRGIPGIVDPRRRASIAARSIRSRR